MKRQSNQILDQKKRAAEPEATPQPNPRLATRCCRNLLETRSFPFPSFGPALGLAEPFDVTVDRTPVRGTGRCPLGPGRRESFVASAVRRKIACIRTWCCTPHCDGLATTSDNQVWCTTTTPCVVRRFMQPAPLATQLCSTAVLSFPYKRKRTRPPVTAMRATRPAHLSAATPCPCLHRCGVERAYGYPTYGSAEAHGFLRHCQSKGNRHPFSETVTVARR